MYSINSQLVKLIDKKVNDGTVSINKLCYGLCARTIIRTLENEASVVDFKLIKLFMERLGKSPNKLEIIVPYEVVENEVLQLNLDEAIDNRDEMTSRVLLDRYKDKVETSELNNIGKMYFLRNKASFDYYVMNNVEVALKDIKSACDLTVPEFEINKLERYSISATELINLLMYYYFVFLTNQEDYGTIKSKLIEIEKYARRSISDEEELARVLPKQKWVSALVFMKEENYTKAVQLCIEGLHLLRKYALFQFMLPLLSIIVEYGGSIILEEEYIDYVEFKKAIEDYCEICGSDINREESLTAESNRIIYHYDLEVLLSQRKIKKMSQEKLAELVGVQPEMISKYETGARRPNKNIYVKIMKELGLEWSRYNTILISESFESMEMMRELILANLQNDYRLMEQYIKALEMKLDMRYVKNRRNLQVFQNEIAFKRGEIDADGFIKMNKELLDCTYPFFEEVRIRSPFSDEERLISQISTMLEKKGENDRALEITKKMLDSLDKSMIDIRLRVRLCGHVYVNYCLQLCRKNNISEAEVIDVARKIYSMRTISSAESLLSILAILTYKKDKEQSCSLMKDSRIIAKMIFSRDNYDIADYNLRRFY